MLVSNIFQQHFKKQRLVTHPGLETDGKANRQSLGVAATTWHGGEETTEGWQSDGFLFGLSVPKLGSI